MKLLRAIPGRNAGNRYRYCQPKDITSLLWLSRFRGLGLRVGMGLENLCQRIGIAGMGLHVLWMLRVLRMLRMQTPHDVAIDVVATTQRVTAFPPFNLKVAMLVEADSPLVVGVHIQFEPHEVEPVIGKIDDGEHQHFADALTLIGVMDRHRDITYVALATFAHREADDANHLPIGLGDKHMPVLVNHPALDGLTPCIYGFGGEYCCTPQHVGHMHDFMNVVGVRLP